MTVGNSKGVAGTSKLVSETLDGDKFFLGDDLEIIKGSFLEEDGDSNSLPVGWISGWLSISSFVEHNLNCRWLVKKSLFKGNNGSWFLSNIRYDDLLVWSREYRGGESYLGEKPFILFIMI